MAYKWGFDGSSGHATYKQRLQDNGPDKSDEHLFAICIVIIRDRYAIL